MRTVLRGIISLVLLLLPFQAFGASIAYDWIWPLGVWNPNESHGYQLSNGLYHMGIDSGFELSDEDGVYAAGAGTVVEVEERTSFGLVVLIEHRLSNGKRIVSLYGHLNPADQPVAVGDVVEAGDRIGSLGVTAVNGGWALHLHFGIHKSEYTGEWVYYGHVSDPATADEWYDPEVFIPKRFGEDTWAPVVNVNLREDTVISDVISFSARATDRGEGVETVTVYASDDGKKSWQELASYTGDDFYPYPVYTSLAGLDPGRIYVKTVARDAAGNKTKQTVRVHYRPDADSTRHFAAIRGAGLSSRAKVVHQDGSRNTAFRPYEKAWEGGGDLAIGDVTGDQANDIVTVKGEGGVVEVRVFSRSGVQLQNFDVLSEKRITGARVTTGDIDGDGVEEIIVGSGPGKRTLIKAYEQDGTLIWRKNAFKKNHTGGVDVATGDFDGDGVDEIVAGTQGKHKPKVAIYSGAGKRTKVFRAFAAKYRGGLNVDAADVDGDGIDEIVAATNGDHVGKVRVFRSNGQRMKRRTFTPFGPSFTGPVDVSSVDWDGDGKDELIMSQAAEGEAWVKTYRSGANKRILTNGRIFAAGFEGGTRIDGWD